MSSGVIICRVIIVGSRKKELNKNVEDGKLSHLLIRFYALQEPNCSDSKERMSMER